MNEPAREAVTTPERLEETDPGDAAAAHRRTTLKRAGATAPGDAADPSDAAATHRRTAPERAGATRAEVRLPSRDLRADLAFYGGSLGFRLESIFPADDPAVAVMAGHGLRIRLERGAEEAPGAIRLLCERPEAFAAGATELEAPSGTRIEIRAREPVFARPPTRHALVVQRMGEGESWVVGRAGMQYRDLIPGRLGGAVIASHIRIPKGGPVPDMVHFHDVAFQLIYCRRGWFDLVYEDQGPPFRLEAGDCVIQPPKIRHRVLESSDNGEVIELGVPAEHLTTIDHDLTLPTATLDAQRDFGGQRFRRHRRRDAAWAPWRLPGFEACRTGVDDATGGIANVEVARTGDGFATGGSIVEGIRAADGPAGSVASIEVAQAADDATGGAVVEGIRAADGPAGGVASIEVAQAADDATGGVANVEVARAGDGDAVVASHDADILFTFVLEGRMRLRAAGLEAQDLRAGDAFVIPPGTRTAYERCSADLELLEVSLPGRFETALHDGL